MKMNLVPNRFRHETCVPVPFNDEADEGCPRGVCPCTLLCRERSIKPCQSGRPCPVSPSISGDAAGLEAGSLADRDQESASQMMAACVFVQKTDHEWEGTGQGALRFHPLVTLLIGGLAGLAPSDSDRGRRRAKRSRSGRRGRGGDQRRSVVSLSGRNKRVSGKRLVMPPLVQDEPPFPLELEDFRLALAEALGKEQKNSAS